MDETINRSKTSRWRAIATSVGLVGLTLLVLGGLAANRQRAEGASDKVTLEQCANLGTTCDAANPGNWRNGNLNSSQAQYYEGDAIPFRSVVTGVTVGATYAMTLEWESTRSAKHAYDYLTSFDFSESGADLCAGSVCSGSPVTLGIPVDSHVTGAGVTPVGGQHFTLYGGTFTGSGSTVANTGNLCGTASCSIPSNPSSYSLVGDYSDTSQTRITVFVTATDTSFVLGWAGHISTRLDWGIDSSAVSISGSPYHMNMHDFACSNDENCGVGSMDRSTSAQAVVFASSITIIKSATPESGEAFGFVASPSPLGNFQLVDDGTVNDRRTFTGITNFTTYTITEQNKAGWNFGTANCQIAAPFGGSWSVDNKTITINLAEGELVTCTVSNSQAMSSTTTTTTVAPTTTVAASTTTAAPTTTVAPATTSTTVAPVTTTTEALPVLLPGTGGGGSRDWISLGALMLLAAGSATSLIAGSRVRSRRMRDVL